MPAGTHLIEVDALGYFFSPVGVYYLQFSVNDLYLITNKISHYCVLLNVLGSS